MLLPVAVAAPNGTARILGREYVIGGDLEVRIGRRKFVGTRAPAVLQHTDSTHAPREVHEGDPRKNRGNLPVPLAEVSIEAILDREAWSADCTRLIDRSASRIWWRAICDGRVFRHGTHVGRYGRFVEVSFVPSDGNEPTQKWLIPDDEGVQVRSTGRIETGTTIAKLQNLGLGKAAVCVATREGLTLDGKTYVLASMVNDVPLTGEPVWRIPKEGVLPLCNFRRDGAAEPTLDAGELDFGNGTAIHRVVRTIRDKRRVASTATV